MRKPYTVKMDCPISGVEEDVFFYESLVDGKWEVLFRGCDHNWSKCLECDICKKEAIPKIVEKYK